MKWSNYKVGVLRIGEKEYPDILSGIKNPPKKLYYRGDVVLLSQKSVAIVGSRRMTRYGKHVVEEFVSAFVLEEIVTISGFMYGVDTEVHERTVEYGGKTIAVFGCGLDVIYPSENEGLYGKILDRGGLVLSEYELESKPHLWKFPQRNRIVAGLSTEGVLVVEAGEKSGSLITARIAKEQGKKVYAIPGPVNSLVSRGTNWLIKEGGALMVTDPADMCGKKVASVGKDGSDLSLNLTETRIWEALLLEPLNVDEVAAQIGEGVVEVGSVLSLMGVRGLIVENGGKYYLNR